MNDASVARWTLHVPSPYTKRDARDWIRRDHARRRSGQALGLTIVRRSDGEVVGGAGLHRIDEGAARAEVGYWLGRPHRGHGYATEAVNLLLAAGFAQLALHRVEARVFPGNAASVGVLRRCGFRYEGRIRDEVQKDGRWRSSLLFSRLSTDPVVRRRTSRGALRTTVPDGQAARRR